MPKKGSKDGEEMPMMEMGKMPMMEKPKKKGRSKMARKRRRGRR